MTKRKERENVFRMLFKVSVNGHNNSSREFAYLYIIIIMDCVHAHIVKINDVLLQKDTFPEQSDSKVKQNSL